MNDHRLQMLHSSQECDWRTPPALYEALAATFPIEIDLAANAEACLTVRDDMNYFLGPDHPNPQMRDALKVPWHELGKCGFLNPSYSLTLYSDGIKAGVDRSELQWLLIDNWARKAYQESLLGFHTIGVFPYASQTEWFRRYVMGHIETPIQSMTDPAECTYQVGWAGHAALDFWRLPHRVSYLRADGKPAANANVNTCVVHWGPNPGFVGPWVPSGRYWSYR